MTNPPFIFILIKRFEKSTASVTWAFSSVGQSIRLITGGSWVRVPEGPPTYTDNLQHGKIPERPKGTDCKSVVFDFGGSNPPLPTTIGVTFMVTPYLFCLKALWDKGFRGFIYQNRTFTKMYKFFENLLKSTVICRKLVVSLS